MKHNILFSLLSLFITLEVGAQNVIVIYEPVSLEYRDLSRGDSSNVFTDYPATRRLILVQNQDGSEETLMTDFMVPDGADRSVLRYLVTDWVLNVEIRVDGIIYIPGNPNLEDQDENRAMADPKPVPNSKTLKI
jgi:hypothetical protein